MPIDWLVLNSMKTSMSPLVLIYQCLVEPRNRLKMHFISKPKIECTIMDLSAEFHFTSSHLQFPNPSYSTISKSIPPLHQVYKDQSTLVGTSRTSVSNCVSTSCLETVKHGCSEHRGLMQINFSLISNRQIHTA